MANFQIRKAKTNKKRMVGHNVSHSNVKTKRTFGINYLTKRISLGNNNKVAVKLTAKMLRTWRKHGSTIAALEKLIAKGDN